MKIRTLVQANVGIPFYTLQNGEFFQLIIFDENYQINIQYIYQALPVFMKVDRVGAIDYPYDKEAERNILYIDDKTLVQTIRKTEKVYKDYSKDQEDYFEMLKQSEDINDR